MCFFGVMTLQRDAIGFIKELMLARCVAKNQDHTIQQGDPNPSLG